MSTFFAFLAGLLLGGLAAYVVASRMRDEPAAREVARFMASAVNMEAAEEKRRANHLHLARSGARTLRTDGGPSATVYRMRKRRTVIREPIDRT